MTIDKKRNPDPEPAIAIVAELPADLFSDPSLDQPQPPGSPTLPDIRTFIVRSVDPTQADGRLKERIVEAHTFEFGEDGLAAFIMCFLLPDGSVVHTPRHIFNRMAWEEIEEIRADFPTLVKH